MKFLDKLALAIFSIIIFILSVIVCLVMFGWLDIELVIGVLKYLKTNEIASNISIGVSVVLLLLSLKSMFFESYSKEEDNSKEGILLENDSGKLVISRDTLENLTTSVSKTIDGVENVISRVMLDKDKNLVIFVNLLVRPDALIKDLSSGLQLKIKETIKDSLGLDVKEVNIKIKNITSEMLQEKQAVKKEEKTTKESKGLKEEKIEKKVEEPKLTNTVEEVKEEKLD